jgi:hypothetical protein
MVVNGKAERHLEGPGQPEAGQLLACERTVAGERALDDQRPHLLAARRAGKRRDRERGAEALAEDDHRPCLGLGAGKQEVERRVEIELQAGEARAAAGQAIAPIVEQQHVEALGRQPGDARDVGADILGVAVQEQDAATPRPLCGQEPAVQPDAVLCLELDVSIVEADLVRRQDQLAHGLEDQAGATAEREPCQERQATDQKYQCSEVNHSICAPSPSSSASRSTSSARFRPSA